MNNFFFTLSELFSKYICYPPVVLLFIAFSINVQADNPKLNFHEWWTSDELHLFIDLEGQMPAPEQNQASYFLTFKNTWVIEAEGIINSRLKRNALKVGSVTAGESSNGLEHHLTLHIVLKQVATEKRHKQCNVMAFIYTTTSDTKDLKKACSDKIDKELVEFKKEWKPIYFFNGTVENKGSTKLHRTRWHGVIGVK